MRQIVRREGQRRQSRFMPCPRQFGRWLWGLPRWSAFHSPDWRMLQPATSFAKIPFSRLPQKHLPAQVNFAPPASRSSPRLGGQGFDRAVKFPSVSIRRWPDGGPCLHEHTTTVPDPNGCFHSRQRTAWRDFRLAGYMLEVTPNAGRRV